MGPCQGHWRCPAWNRSTDLLEELRSYREDLAVQLLSNKYSIEEMTDHSLPKDRTGKIWERSTDRSPILSLALKRKAAFNANTVCHLSLPYKFLTYWLMSVKCQSWRFQRDWIYMRFIKMGARQKRKACLQQHWGKGHNANTNLIRQQRIHKGHVMSTGNLRAHTMLNFRESRCKQKWEETSFTSLGAGFHQGSAAWVCFARQSPGSFRNPTYSCGISCISWLEGLENPVSACSSGKSTQTAVLVGQSCLEPEMGTQIHQCHYPKWEPDLTQTSSLHPGTQMST